MLLIASKDKSMVKLCYASFAVFALLSHCDAFSICSHASFSKNLVSLNERAMVHGSSSRLFSSLENGDESNAQNQSFLEGNRREPTPQEISIMDDMITKLAEAKPYELPNAVSKAIRVISSPRFFMRIAERADITSDPVEKEKLSSLASNLATTLEAVVSSTEDKLDDRAKSVETIVKAAAEPGSGEFLVPLSMDRINAMREKLQKLDEEDLDEGFLSTVDAWMNKSHEDGLDGMVEILQKVLQIYAGTTIQRARSQLKASVGASVVGKSQAEADKVLAEQEASGPSPVSIFVDKLLSMDTDLWDSELAGAKSDGTVKSSAVLSEVQGTIEAVVLGLENGSMKQRVLAEYLRELVTRIETSNK